MKIFNTISLCLTELIEILNNNLNVIKVHQASTWSNTGWSVPPSVWNDFEIFYFTEGRTSLRIENVDYTARAGDVFFIDGSEAIYCENGSFTYLTFIFAVNDSKGINSNEYIEIRNYFRKIPRRYFYGKNKYLEEYYIDMIKESVMKQTGYEIKLKFSMVEILIEILRSMNSFSQVDSPYRYKKYSGMVADIITFLSENLQRNFTLSELGKKYRLNPRYLNRIFKGVTGYPVFQYLQRLRVEKAKKLLKSCSISILDISLEVGFGSGQGLSRTFKKITGFTPGEYKKM